MTRTPDQNNPLRPAYQRPERKTRRTYADPTGGTAAGRVRKDDPEGAKAQARAARRALLEARQQ